MPLYFCELSEKKKKKKKKKKKHLANPLLIDNCIFKLYSKMYPITNTEISHFHTYLHDSSSLLIFYA